MFFDLILLNRQHRARFGFAWLAATRGITNLTKKDVLEIDLTKLSDDIMEFLSSESDNPSARFSLRLSSLLVNGTVKIYRQRAIFLMEEVVKVLSTVSTPLHPQFEAKALEGFAKQPTPIPRKKGTKRRRSAEESTPQSEIDKIVAEMIAQEKRGFELPLPPVEQELSVIQARIDEITLRETQILPRSQEITLEEDFGALGPVPTEEEQLLGVSHPARELFPPLPGEKVQQEEVPPRDMKRSRKLSSSSPSEPDTGRVILTVEAMVHQPAGVEETPEQPRFKSPVPQRLEKIISVAQAEVKMTLPRRRPLRELSMEIVDEREPPRDKRKEKMDKNKFALSTKTPKFVRIDRPGTGEFVGFPEPRLQPINKKETNLKKLLDLYVLADTRRETGRKVATPRDSSQLLEKRSTGETPPAQISTTAPSIPSISEQMAIVEEAPQVPMETDLVPPVPVITSTPVVARPSELEKEPTVEQVMAVTVEELLESPRKRRRLTDVEPLVKDLDYITLPSEFQSRELTGSVLTFEQVAVESAPLSVTTVEGRHQDIVNKILVSGRLTLEELCQKPVNRLHIARAFSDVLVLSRHGYVTLTSEETSSELKFVEKGPKLSHLI